MKRFVFMLSFMVAIFLAGCSKQSQIDNSLKESAYTTLKAQMLPQSFANINWEKSVSKKFNGEEFLIIAPDNINPNKSLYFVKKDGATYYNWVEHQNVQITKNKISETIILTDIQDKPIKTLHITNNKIVTNLVAVASIQSNSDPSDPVIEGSGGDAVVTGYIQNDPTYLYNLGDILNVMSLLNFYDASSNVNPIYLPFNSPHSIKATVQKFPDHTYWTAADNQQLWGGCTVNIKFSLDLNGKLQIGTQSANVSGPAPLGTFTMDSNQSPNPVYSGTTFTFIITGILYVSGINIDTTIVVSGDTKNQTSLSINYPQ